MARPPQTTADTPATAEQGPPPPDLLPDLQARLDLALRRADLLERRVAAWERELAEVKKDLQQLGGAAATVDAEADRLVDLESRVRRLENRSLQAMARQAGIATAGALGGPGRAGPGLPAPDDDDACALVFARWMPMQAASGDPVNLAVKLDGFSKGDVVEFSITELGATEPFEPLRVTLSEENPDQVGVQWKPPRPAKGGHREFTFVVRGRGQEAKSPVLSVQG